MPPIPIYEQSIQTQDQRVLDRRSEIRWWEKPLEVVKTYPRASKDTGFRIVPPEGQLNTVHGNVAENKGQHHTRHTEQPERQISLESSDRTAFLFSLWFDLLSCVSPPLWICVAFVTALRHRTPLSEHYEHSCFVFSLANILFCIMLPIQFTFFVDY